VFGFAGFCSNRAFIQGQPNDVPPNAAGSSRTGVAQCFTTSGDSLRDSQLHGTDTTLITDGLVPGTPCINVGRFVDGRVLPKRSKGDGFTYKLNATWKPHPGLMFYGTWSKGFRPGGINRQPGLPGYEPDFLTNYELGWKTTFGPLRWNGAIYHQLWDKMQFSFLGPNALTVVQNGRQATINGVETDINYLVGGLSLTAAAAYTDAKTKGNICNAAIAIDPTPDCTGLDALGRPDAISAPSGTRLPVTPKIKVTGTARYTWAMGPGKTHVQLAVTSQGSAPSALRTADEQSQGKLKAYTLVDLFFGYDWNKYSVEAFGTNVFDTRNQLSKGTPCGFYCGGATVDFAGNPLTTDWTRIVVGTPRTIGIRAGMKF
jgi:iron complex outermembrane receptor protein